MKNKNTCFIYKNDLKFNDNFDFEKSEIENHTMQIYNNFKDKPKIELRIEDSKMENYKYLDLSKLDVDDKNLIELIKLDRVDAILKRIEFLDLSYNKLKLFPDLKKYPNIYYLNISFNSIELDIYDDNLLELTCNNNKIKSIKSTKLTHLNASFNDIEMLDVPNINTLVINYNKLIWIQSYLKLKFLECIGNQLSKIDNMIELEELYVGNNKISNIVNMPKLKVLNCVNNPLDKIKYFPNLVYLMSSTAKVSSQYNVSNITKIKNDYTIKFI